LPGDAPVSRLEDPIRQAQNAAGAKLDTGNHDYGSATGRSS
jgi:hypothetical protein